MNLVVALAEPGLLLSPSLWVYFAVIYLFFGVPLLSLVAVLVFLFSVCFPGVRSRLRGSSLSLGMFSVGNASLAYFLGSGSSTASMFSGLWQAALLTTPILFFAAALLPRRSESAADPPADEI